MALGPGLGDKIIARRTSDKLTRQSSDSHKICRLGSGGCPQHSVRLFLPQDMDRHPTAFNNVNNDPHLDIDMIPSSETATINTTGQEKEKTEEVLVNKAEDEEAAQTASTPALPLTFPEGGFDAWKTVFGAWLIQYTCFGYINTFGTFEDYYVRQYLTNYTPSDIGWIGGIQIFLTFSTGAFSGLLFDKGYLCVPNLASDPAQVHDRVNHSTYLLAATLILNSLGLFMLSITHENSYYQVFLSHGVILGLATGLTWVPSLGIAGHYFQRRRALAVGIIASGAALGAVINPIMLNQFFTGAVGFHNGVRISAGINTFLLIIALLITRARLPPKGLQRFPIGQWFKEPPYVCLLISIVFLFFGLFYPVFNVQLNAVTHGVDRNVALYTTSILNAASLFGRILPGLLVPITGTFNIGVFLITCTGGLVFCLLAVKDAAGTIVFSIFYGFFSGAAIAIAPASIALLAKSPAEIGTRMGIFFGIGGLIGLFATPISGALLTNAYIWVRPDIFAGVTLLAGAASYTMARYFYGRGKASYRM
ncbi:major facilitator superfamily domain-containing protein [Crepidotus variabilis]|uniref:Major facilitator superfamily domain-containing protein n=1 Tax=Crepidotus variabilis TaxID=179855 RepID=A0A9P6ELW1_9AGAR|nr:major facilitator superfamily domain-containing protein [Crepidotus variabilis]